MRVKKNLFSVIVISMAVAFSVATFTSCMNPTQQTVVYKSIASVELSTKASYQSYIGAVVSGIATTNAVPTISGAFDHFQHSVMLATELAQQNTNALAPSSLVTESGDLVNLINGILNKK